MRPRYVLDRLISLIFDRLLSLIFVIAGVLLFLIVLTNGRFW
jgi:hypothetical protein